MRGIYIFCEGATEQGFCKTVLEPHLFPQGEGRLHPIKIAHSRSHRVAHRGGVGSYAAIRGDIQRQLKSRPGDGVWITTLIDVYGLPGDFPALADTAAAAGDPLAYVRRLEEAFGKDIDAPRFIPHLQLHEFEAMLFADPDAFTVAFERCAGAVAALKAISAKFPSVEHIDNSPRTAPSKRIIELIPAYAGRKADAGPAIAARIGLPRIRQKCRHLDGWLRQLEQTLR